MKVERMRHKFEQLRLKVKNQCGGTGFDCDLKI